MTWPRRSVRTRGSVNRALADGLYLVNITAGGQRCTERLVIQ